MRPRWIGVRARCDRDRKRTRQHSSDQKRPSAAACVAPILTGEGANLEKVGARAHVERGLRQLFFFNDTATTEIYTLSLHDALPISGGSVPELIFGDRVTVGISH